MARAVQLIDVSDKFARLRRETVEGYCMKCKEKKEMKDVKQVTMKNGKAASEGVCPDCGTKIFKIGAAK